MNLHCIATKTAGGGRRVLACLLAVVLTIAMVPAISFAAVVEYSLPTKATSLTHTAIDDEGNEYTYRHLTTAATMYAEFNVEMLGLSDLESNPKTVVSTWDAAVTDSKAGIFASDANESPDEFLANYYYNLYVSENPESGLLPVDDSMAVYQTRWDYLSDSSDFDNLFYSVYYGADILFVTSSYLDTYAEQVKTKNEGISEDSDEYYDPVYCIPGTGTTLAMVDGEYRLANAADQVILNNIDEDGHYTVQSRYVDDASTYTIADDFAAVAYATQYYVLSQIAAGNTTKKTVAVVSDYDTVSQTYTLMNLDVNLSEIRGTGNAGHLAAGIQNTVNDYCDTLGIVDDGTEQYATGVTAAQLAEADYVLFSDYFSDTQYSNSQQIGKDEAVTLLKQAMGDSADGRILSNYPGLVFNFLYASSAESIFNYAIAQAFVYSDIIDFTDMMAYWYTEINHISKDSIQDMVDTLCATMSLPQDMTSIGTVSENYVESIESQFAEGYVYYEANEEAIVAAAPALEKPTSTELGVGRTKIADQTYTGSAVTPEVSVYTITGDEVSSDCYSVEYANNVEIGLAEVTITGSAGTDYEGQSFTTYFMIEEATEESEEPDATTVEFVDLSGADRYETMRNIVEAGDFEGDCIVLAKGEGAADSNGWADALASSSLAGVLDAPIVTTDTEALPESTLAVLEESSATTVYIVGGTDSVSTAVEETLVNMGYTVNRLGGADRQETSVLVARETLAISPSTTCIVATGNSFPDALAASPVAYAEGAPIILTESDGTLDSAAAALASDMATVLIAGGESSVARSVESAYNAERLSGADRYGTAAAMAEYAYSQGILSYDGAGIASGENFPDALAGGALCGRNGSVLLLFSDSDSGMACLDLLSAHGGSIAGGYFLSGTSLLSPMVRDSILNAVNGE